jgi:hypothetical protein
MPPTSTRPAGRRCGSSIWWLLALLPLVSQDQCTGLSSPKRYEMRYEAATLRLAQPRHHILLRSSSLLRPRQHLLEPGAWVRTFLLENRFGEFTAALLLPILRCSCRRFSDFYGICRENKEPTSGLEPLTCSLRVIGHVLQGCAGACNTRIDKRRSLLLLAVSCTVLRSRWYQSGINITLVSTSHCRPPLVLVRHRASLVEGVSSEVRKYLVSRRDPMPEWSPC